MDVESKETIAASIAQLKTAGDEIVDRAGTAGQVLAEQIHKGIAAATSEIVDAFNLASEKACGDLRRVIESLDGWNLEITIPPINIMLNKPHP
jgi:hypothetical protein